MIRKFLPVLCVVMSLFAGGARAQSSNAAGAVARIDAANLQSRSEKGQNSGYAGLNSSGFVPPANLFPDFASSPDGTIWVKSSTTLAPLSSSAFSSSGVTTNNVLLGAIDTSTYGIKINAVNSPLVLKGGSTINRVMVEYNQSIGGASSDRSSYLWSISPSGAFVLAGGSLSGDIDMNSNDITELATSAGSSLTINYATNTLTSASGNVVVSAPTGAGLVVPSTASSSNTTFALNPTSADTLYGRLTTTNTWTQIQTFSSAPVVPDSSFSIAKTASLQTSLDAALKKDGTNAATANLNLGGYKITNVGTPSSSGDAVSLSYLTSNYDSTPVNSLTIALSGTEIAVDAANGDVTLSIPRSSGTVSGYLHKDDWATFNGKQASLSATAPISITSNTVAMTQSSSSVNGWLSAADYARFENPSSITDAKISSILTSKVSQTDATTTSPTSVMSYTIPAGKLAAGDVIVLKIAGNFIINTDGETLTLQFKLGGTTALDGTTILTLTPLEAAFAESSSEVPYVMEVTMVVRTAGASGTAMCAATILTPTHQALSIPAEVAIDTTVSRILGVVATISAITGSPANHISSEVGTVRIN